MKRPARRAISGLGLAELMVAIAVGMLVVLAGSALFVSSSAGYSGQTETSRLDDNGRYALNLLARAARQTAFINWDGAAAPAGLAGEDSPNIAGLDARTIGRAADGIDAPLVAGVVNGSDVLALRYYGAGPAGAGDGSVLNCAGFGVGEGAAAADRGWSIFYVAQDAGGEAELRCKYRGASSWGADAIVRGVDSFQVLYGLDTDTPSDGVANRFINAGGIDALDALLALSGADAAARLEDLHRQTWWKRVVSIKIALLLHGQPGSRGDGLPVSYALFGPEYAGMAGVDAGVLIDEKTLAKPLQLRARRLMVTTIVLRNRPA